MVPDLTFISSWGRTGTLWLNTILNFHPRIASVHGAFSPPRITEPITDHTQLFRTDKNDETKPAWGRSSFYDLSLPQMVEEMREAAPDKPYRCRVHAISAFELDDKIRKEGYPGFLARANMLRHPVTRIDSYHRKFVGTMNLPDFEEWAAGFWLTDPRCAQARERLPEHLPAEITGDDFENALWIISAIWVEHDFNDLEIPVLHVPYERLVGDVEYLTWFLRTLFGEDLSLDAAFFRRVREQSPLNASRRTPLSAVEIHGGWRDWQKDYFRHFVLAHRLKGRYRPFQYDFSFIA